MEVGISFLHIWISRSSFLENVSLVCLGFHNRKPGNSMAAQWWRLSAPTAGGMGSIPGQGSQILQTAWTNEQKENQTSWLKQQTLIFSQFWNPKIHNQGGNPGGLWWGLCPWLTGGCLHTESSHGPSVVHVQREIFSSSCKVTRPVGLGSHTMISFNRNYLPTGSVFKYSPMGAGGLELHHVNLGHRVGRWPASVHNSGVMCYCETKDYDVWANREENNFGFRHDGW